MLYDLLVESYKTASYGGKSRRCSGQKSLPTNIKSETPVSRFKE